MITVVERYVPAGSNYIHTLVMGGQNIVIIDFSNNSFSLIQQFGVFHYLATIFDDVVSDFSISSSVELEIRISHDSH